MKKKLKGHPTAKVESLIQFMLRINSGMNNISRTKPIKEAEVGKKEKKKRK
jgi:hypothetical protein